ncbi:hypothetical protein M0R45_014249 [Rubus argutus]|uniref:DEAD-box RNA helicase Q domain-containing protein n=1 Tax=Rubus argutus TaxID=59490 RepID=A0AAW1XM77_RUBAR
MASDQIDGEVKTFKNLGLCDQLVEAVAKLDWANPTPIQVEAIPHALEGKDLIGLAQTGDSPHAFFAVRSGPTRELAIQISEQFEA